MDLVFFDTTSIYFEGWDGAAAELEQEMFTALQEVCLAR